MILDGKGWLPGEIVAARAVCALLCAGAVSVYGSSAAQALLQQTPVLPDLLLP